MSTTGLPTRQPVRALAAAVAAALALATPAVVTLLEHPNVVAEHVAPPAVSAEVRDVLAVAGSADVIVRAVPGHVWDARNAVRDGGGDLGVDLPIVDGFSATITRDTLERLEALGSSVVHSVTLDGPVAFNGKPSKDGDTSGGGGSKGGGPSGESSTGTTSISFDPGTDSYFVETVGADALHARGVTGQGVGIAILDTGVSAVADLQGRVVGGVDLSAEADGVDRYGHGTFLAGISAGSGASSSGEHAGVAPGAHVVPVKIAGANGAADVSHVLAALQWVVSFKDTYDIEVLNLSFGTDSTQSQRVDPMNYAVEKAWDAGIVVVAAAANHGPSGRTVMKPGDDPLVITVGATDSMGTTDRSNDIVSDFSSRGPTIADGFSKPDLVAPGAHVVGLRTPGSTIDVAHPEGRVGTAYFKGSGTSFSTAVVSGAAALLKQAHPTWTPDQVKGALLATTAPGPVGDPYVDGFGALDVARADALSSPPSANAGVQRSDGTGSLDASRGTLELTIITDTTTSLVGTLWGVVTDPVGSVLKILSGETTAQDLLFDSLSYRSDPWTAARWHDTDWNAARWHETDWNAARWHEAAWYGTWQ